MTPRSARLWWPVFIIAGICVVTALVVWLVAGRRDDTAPESEQAAWKDLAARGDDLRLWIQFVDLHADEDDSPISDEAIRQRLAKVPRGPVATLAAFWYEHVSKSAKPDASVLTLANAPNPPRYANLLLARVALDDEENQWQEAARRFEREGDAHADGRKENLQAALAVYVDHNAWDDVRRRVRDPRYRGVVDAAFRLELAMHDHDWAGILLWLWPAG